ncbi:MAG: membrane protein insertion efficiency factor YidD [Bacilli bacterium]|nr:membrane protein insertion efficiency factor YidD [Bacilli bacterium]MBR1748761.1 membrane protein insertion efficiency factor YidD [Bacilli bacterium]MBR1817946.1 membrane protein insertion efficiency factor YidD [Bacilli bacterium]
MKKIVIFLIRLYQMIPFSTHYACRCTPTCSEYMIEAIHYYGLLKGIKLGVIRILKCRPHGIYGYQPLIKNEEESI